MSFSLKRGATGPIATTLPPRSTLITTGLPPVDAVAGATSFGVAIGAVADGHDHGRPAARPACAAAELVVTLPTVGANVGSPIT